MTNENVTIRHLRRAIDLLMSGAVREIETQFADTESPECKAVITTLFDEAGDVLAEWDVEGTMAGKTGRLLTLMQNEYIAPGRDEAARSVVLELLSATDLLP